VTTSNTRTRKAGESKNAPDSSSPENVLASEQVDSAPAPGFLIDEIRELIKLVEASEITELSIENGAQKILIKREKQIIQTFEAAPHLSPRGGRHLRSQLSAVPGSSETLAVSDTGSPSGDTYHKLVAPMLGTFYRAPDPKARNFVSEGELVEKGQVIGIIESMKIMNEILSEHSGRCVKINVETGQPVEYGQTLFLLEPV